MSYRQVQDAPAAAQPYEDARQKIMAGQTRDAIPSLEAYLKQAPNGQHADEALFLLGKNAINAGDPEGATRHFSRVIAMNPPSRLRGQSYYFKAVAESQLGQRKDALADLAKIEVAEIPNDQRHALFSFWGNEALQDGRALESTLAYLKALRDVNEPARRKKLEDSVIDQVNTRLSETELVFVQKEYPADFPANEVDMRLVSLKLASGQRDQARQLLERVLSRAPQGSPAHTRATELMGRIGSLQVTNVGKIGALLPLSGDQESLGRAVVDGLKEAFKNAKQPFEVVLADAGPSAESAKAAFDRLVFEDKVMAVVGPLQGAQAEAVATKAMEYGVPNISLAVRSGLTEIGAYVFRVALTPQKQVQALVGYSQQKLNAKNFAVLFPRDNFGREFATEYFKAVHDWSGEVTAAESYDPEQSDFRVPIDNMTAMSFAHFRKTENEERLKLLEEKLGRKPSRKEAESAANPPIVDFDVLMVPDTFRAVGQIVPALLYANVTSPKIVGPSTWNNPRLLARAGQYLDGGLFVDIFAPERQSQVTKSFVEKFQVEKGGVPSPLAAIGHDVGLALKVAYGGSAPGSRDELRSRLENLGNFEGVCGLYAWDTKREPLSEVQLYTIRHGAFSHQGGIVIRSPNSN